MKSPTNIWLAFVLTLVAGGGYFYMRQSQTVKIQSQGTPETTVAKAVLVAVKLAAKLSEEATRGKTHFDGACA